MLGIGIFEFIAMPLSVCIVGGLMLFFAIRRVQKKLGSGNKPTTWEFINELGGYALLAVILIAYSLFTFFNGLLSMFL